MLSLEFSFLCTLLKYGKNDLLGDTPTLFCTVPVVYCFFMTKIMPNLESSVADPNQDPDPPDPHVLGPPGSGSISQRYGSGFGTGTGSGSFYHQAKIIRNTLSSAAL